MTMNHITLFEYDKVDLELNGRQICALAGYHAIKIVQEAPPNRRDQNKSIGFDIGNSQAPMAQEIKSFDRKSYVGEFGSDGIFVGYGGWMTITILDPIRADAAFDQFMGMDGSSKLRDFPYLFSADGRQKLEREHREKHRQIEDVTWFADVVERAERGEHFTWSGLITDKVTEKTITMTGGHLEEYPMLMGLNNDSHSELTFCISSFDL